ncbi:twin-arginine translocation signal domain-containing protein, partial [Streptomyces spiralis]
MALDRRKFLKKSAATGAGVALAGAAAAPAA